MTPHVPTTTEHDDPRRTGRTAFAIAAMFFVNGATFSNWLPRIPEVRDSLGLGNAGLGATLLGGGLGGVIGALTVGRITERLGSRRLLTVAAIALSIGMPLISVAPTAAMLAMLLITLGGLDVLADAAMNSQAVAVQERMQRTIMNRMHAMWSLGFTSGALVGSVALAAGLGLRVHLGLTGAVLLTTVLVCRRWFIVDDGRAAAPVAAAGGEVAPVGLIAAEPVGEPCSEATGTAVGDATLPAGGGRVRRSPTGSMVAMALAAVAAITLEMAPNDWSAVFFTDVFDAGRTAGFATLACAGAMLIGRLAGDHVLERIGERRMLRSALTLIAVGLAVTVAAPVPMVAVAGLMLWGLGLAPMFPLIYTAAARVPGASAGRGLGWMLVGQRCGAMANALAMGTVSDWQGMRVAFAVVCGSAVVVLARAMR
jgi:predicted MFS family arabinose efflux permease